MIDQGWQHFHTMARERRRQYRAVEKALGLRPQWIGYDAALVGVWLAAAGALAALTGLVP